MSFLDNLFRQTTTDLEVAPAVIDEDSTIESGYLYAIEGSGADIALTLTPTLVEVVAGKRIALKVSSVDPSGGELSLTVPDGMTIEDDSGQFVGAFGISMSLGDYREWLCDAAGNWFLVSNGGGGGSGISIVDEDDELRPPASRATFRNSDTVTFVVTTDEDNNGVFIDAEAVVSEGSVAPVDFTWSGNAASIAALPGQARNFRSTNTLGGNSALTITGGEDGSHGLIFVQQDGTGSRTITVTISGRTIKRDLNSSDDNPLAAASSETCYQYFYYTNAAGTPCVMFNKVFIA